ncbi:MAG: hypothetical protein K0Q72_2850 [Armatimonadetes bacterium]|nr:hypothetical protein [Armatimonadota bacterium]
MRGNELIATSASDLFFRWQPGVSWSMMRIHHPLPGLDLEVSPTARFGGYAPVFSQHGVVVSDDQTHRFLTALDGFPHNRWHRDIDWTMGVPSVDGPLIFTGAGGPGATRGILAIDSRNGAPRWVFPSEGIPAASQRMLTIKQPKTVNVPTGNTLRSVRSGGVIPNGPVETDQVQLPVAVPQPNSTLPHGHWTNAGLVVVNSRVYGEVNRSIVSLDQRTGSVHWEYPLNEKSVVHSLVATADHLVFCASDTPKGERLAPWDIRRDDATEDYLVALRLDNGKREWLESVPRPGTLSLAGGMVYFANGDLHAFGPSERTYHLAADSNRAEDYQSPETPPAALQADCGDDAPAPAAPRADPQKPKLDASILRLTYDQPVAELVRLARSRRALTGGMPLVITLDWLTPDRSRLRGPNPGPTWTPDRIKAFVEAVRAIATGSTPAHFDLAPEVNVYLTKRPAEIETVRSVIRAAAAAVHQASPNTKVLLSFNAEVLSGSYGHTRHLSLGEMPNLRPDDLLAILGLLKEVEEVGLSAFPQSGFTTEDRLPAGYLLALKPYLERKPILVTRLQVQVDGRSPMEVAKQAAFLPRLLRECYWLHAEIVARPEVSGQELAVWPKEAKVTLAEALQISQQGWNYVPHWTRVGELSVAVPEALAAGGGVAPAVLPARVVR